MAKVTHNDVVDAKKTITREKDMSLERLNPGVIVEIDDPILNGRKLGLVDDTGVGYFDLHGESELPKPIHSELHPQELGTITSWAAELPEDVYPQFVEAWDHLTRLNLDVLTIARGLRWGITNRSFDPGLVEQMGQAETEKVRKGREHVAKAISA